MYNIEKHDLSLLKWALVTQVSTVPTLWVGWQENCGLIPSEGEIYSLLPYPDEL
jgi:hypothetical protein